MCSILNIIQLNLYRCPLLHILQMYVTNEAATDIWIKYTVMHIYLHAQLYTTQKQAF